MPKLKILVIEDDLFFQKYVNDLLIETGADILTAPDGEIGLRMAASERPDIILTDIEIPKLQGFVLLRHLRSREETASIPVVMMSGKVEKDVFDRHAQLRVHADGYLVKPFSGTDLHQMIQRVLGTRVRPAPLPAEEVKAPDSTDPGCPSLPLEEAASEAGAGARPLRVLVVDDSPFIRTMVKDALQETGMEILEASDGEMGLARAEETLPDVVLIDVQMPKLNGFVVCERLKKSERTAHIPTVLMSAVVDSETFKKHSKLRNHADAYLQKPFRKGDLVAMLARVTGRKAAPSPREGKMGFLLPPEEPSGERPSAPSEARTAANAKLRQALDFVEKLKVREKDYKKQLSQLSRERDRAREELKLWQQESQDRQRELSEKLTLALKRINGIAAEEDQHADDVKKLKMALAAAAAAKREIEDQAAHLMRQQQEAAARHPAADAAEKAAWKEKEKDYARRVSDLEGMVSSLTAERDRVTSLATEADQARKMAARETAARMEAESRLHALTQERDQARRELAALRESASQLEERARASLAEMKKALQASRLEQERQVLEKEKGEEVLRTELARIRQEAEELRSRSADLAQQLVEARKRAEEAASAESQLGEREKAFAAHLEQMRKTFETTVREAQTVLMDQRGREDRLESQVKAIRESLEQEKIEYRKDRQEWTAREEDLRRRLELALEALEEKSASTTAKVFPLPMEPPRRVEVVSHGRRAAAIASMGLLMTAAFFSGYLALSRLKVGAPPPATPPGVPEAPAAAVAAPIPAPAPAPIPEEGLPVYREYERAWARQTVESVTEDLRVQATLHTREEMELAIRFTAGKENWGEDRLAKAMADLAETYHFDQYIYATVFVKNLKGGYPGYAESLERHLVLRGSSGKEVPATVPGELGRSRFVNSHLVSAAKARNKVYLYEVGLMVAFPRDPVDRAGRRVQLLLYDVGALPVRTLTWELSGWGV